MSEDQITILRADIAALKAVTEERGKVAERNGLLLKTVALGFFLQIVVSIFVAGQKTQRLDDLTAEVASLRMDIHHPDR
jgi:hypothetical protein